MKGKGLCLALALALVLSAAPAAALGGGLTVINTYAGFADVAEDAWYYTGVRTCYEVGLMEGTGDGSFSPGVTMTVAQAATIAARLRELLTGEIIPGVTPRSGESLPWYQKYVEYLSSHGVTVAEPTKDATRQEFFALLSAVASRDLLAPINAISSLPDTDDADVLAFYNAGILTGTDAYGTFNGGGTLTRAECAVMVARLADPAQRQSFVPQGQEASAGETEEQGGSGDQVVMTVNGVGVPLLEYVNRLLLSTYNLDYNLYSRYGQRLDWDTDYGVGDLAAYLKEQTVDTMVQLCLLNAQAEALGCSLEELEETMIPQPSHETLSTYAQGRDYLAAKHILVGDLETANAVLGGLDAVPTLEQFNALLAVFGTDPGMESNPDGYLFTSGTMVAEFESGTRALEVGTYSPEPVQTTYGYHIIWRLDPADHPDLLDAYRDEVMDAMLNTWVSGAQITVDEALVAQLDLRETYTRYLMLLAEQ